MLLIWNFTPPLQHGFVSQNFYPPLTWILTCFPPPSFSQCGGSFEGRNPNLPPEVAPPTMLNGSALTQSDSDSGQFHKSAQNSHLMKYSELKTRQSDIKLRYTPGSSESGSRKYFPLQICFKNCPNRQHFLAGRQVPPSDHGTSDTSWENIPPV